tara:strand:- start:279 stop:566 length:288 start_codon:yes stop_codon:yes gene_type:complete
MKNQKTNSQYKSKYYKPIIKSKAMPNVDEHTKYRDLKYYDREALLKWLILDDSKHGLRSSKASFNRQGIATLKSEILARIKLENNYKKFYSDTFI